MDWIKFMITIAKYSEDGLNGFIIILKVSDKEKELSVFL